mmetsp:Transcript_39249/g.126115  ORF Transcript_39249/g.126115 Transcript_39249/m.126115 type:complete len:287 (+) Transcript_39249:60-920(+)
MLLPLLVRTSPSLRCASPSLSLGGDLGVALYDAQVAAQVAVEAAVSHELTSLSPVSALVLYGAGLLTSLTPCCLSMLPLTMSYIGSGSFDEGGGGGSQSSSSSSSSSFGASLAFAGGLACSLSALGVAAASAGAMLGSGTDSASFAALRLLVSLLTCVLGLNLLKVLPFELPSLELSTGGVSLPRPARAFLFGASSALVASPCASPVLVSLLGFVATQGDPLLGAALLTAYSLGETTPVLLAGIAAGSATRIVSAQRRFEWVTPVSGSALLAIGTYNGLSSAFGPV